MKKLFFLIITFLLSIAIVYAQENYTEESGKITQYEMDITEYPNDPDAEALMIYNNGYYRFIFDDHQGFMLAMTTHTKIKIFSQAGVKYADFEIPLFIENNRLGDSFKLEEATTYNYENNTLTKDKLDEKNIFEEQINQKWFRKKFTMPNVKAGSIIEVKYTVTTPFFVNMRTWKLQQKIPVLKSNLQYRAIPYYEYVYQIKGLSKLDIFNSTVDNTEIRHGYMVYKELVYNFGLKNIPAFRDEDFITSEKDHMTAITWQLSRINYPQGGKQDYITTWPELTQNLLKENEHGKYINNARKEARKILPTLQIDGLSDLDKVKTITQYVKNNYNWNGYYGKYSTQKVSDLLKNKSGSVADLNLFLTGLLQEAKLDAFSIISSTRDNGMIDKSYPFGHLFNYTLAKVDINGKQIFLDATDPLLPYNIVPSRCVNTLALVIKPKVEEWAFIIQKAPSYLQKNITIKLNGDGKYMANAEYTSLGDEARHYKSKYLGDDEKLIDYIQSSEKLEKITNLTIDNEKKDNTFAFQFEFENPIEIVDEKMFIQPFCNLQTKQNLFNQKERKLPIDLIHIIGRRYNSNIAIPEGYTIEHLPDKMNIDNDLVNISYNAKQEGDTLNIQAAFSFKKNIYEPKDYNSLKNLYTRMLNRFEEMIILVKKIEEGETQATL